MMESHLADPTHNLDAASSLYCSVLDVHPAPPHDENRFVCRSRGPRTLVTMMHPDDGAPGCGRALAHHAANSDRVRLLYLSADEGSR